MSESRQLEIEVSHYSRRKSFIDTFLAQMTAKATENFCDVYIRNESVQIRLRKDQHPRRMADPQRPNLVLTYNLPLTTLLPGTAILSTPH